MNSPHLRTLLAFSTLAFLLAFERDSRGEVDYLREVRPILSSYCFKCHGQDSAARKSGLRLDLPVNAFQR